MAVTRCPNCRFENQPEALFCAKCATKLDTVASGEGRRGAEPSVTKTLETTPKGLGKGKLFAGRFELMACPL